ncbi:hypothetical protein KTJ87_02965 [Rhodobacteraceae bacterium ASV31]|nr:hypothetical protein [Anianabacter salinae]
MRAASGPISTACARSERGAKTPAVCSCIQGVADVSLSSSDQRMAAKFFADPHQAQEIRQSDNPRHEVFWKKYVAFGEQAELYCRV